jgi:hypothetical protein
LSNMRAAELLVVSPAFTRVAGLGLQGIWESTSCAHAAASLWHTAFMRVAWRRLWGLGNPLHVVVVERAVVSHEVALSRRAFAKHSLTSAFSFPCAHHTHSSCAPVCRQGICCYVILKAGVEESPALALEMKGQVGALHSSLPLSPSPTRPACVLIFAVRHSPFFPGSEGDRALRNT